MKIVIAFLCLLFSAQTLGDRITVEMAEANLTGGAAAPLAPNASRVPVAPIAANATGAAIAPANATTANTNMTAAVVFCLCPLSCV